MLFLVVVRFENICIGCSGLLYTILLLFLVAADDSIVVVTIGNQSGRLQFDSRGWPILDSRFVIFLFSSSGGLKLLILVEDVTVLIALVKILECRRASHHPDFRGNHPNISHTC